MLLALFVYANITRLGDTPRYLRGPQFLSGDLFYNSTHMMDTLAHGLSMVLGPVLANLPFVFLSVYGIYYAVKRLRLSNNQLIIVLGLLSLPNFSIWSSIASKEAMGVFYMGILTGFIIDLIKKRPQNNYLLIALAFYLCAVFKPQYLSGIIALLVFLFISRKLSLNGFGKLGMLGAFFLCSFTLLYIFRDIINELSFIMPLHFNMDGTSTRENTIWVEDYDVFWNAPYGMLIAFIGPTLGEALSRLPHFLAFIESLFVVAAFVLGLMKLSLVAAKTGKLNIFYLSLFIAATLWILFVHYPFGALNPGSAIRYRTNFYGFFVVLFYYLYSEILSGYRIQNQINRYASTQQSSSGT